MTSDGLRVVSAVRLAPTSETDSGFEVKSTYTEDDVAGGAEGLAARLGLPGEPPFTRGPYPLDVPGPALDDAPVRRFRVA